MAPKMLSTTVRIRLAGANALGSVRIGGAKVSGRSAREHREAGLAHIPSDRLQRGLVADAHAVVAHDLHLGVGVGQPLTDARIVGDAALLGEQQQPVDLGLEPDRPGGRGFAALMNATAAGLVNASSVDTAAGFHYAYSLTPAVLGGDIWTLGFALASDSPSLAQQHHL